MTEQLKAEAYVREQRPAKRIGVKLCVEHTMHMSITPEIFVCKNCIPEYEPNPLQDWLAVLGEMFAIDSYGNTLLFNTENDNYGLAGLRFNLTTGQPATESDYQAFNEIVK